MVRDRVLSKSSSRMVGADPWCSVVWLLGLGILLYVECFEWLLEVFKLLLAKLLVDVEEKESTEPALPFYCAHMDP